MNKKIAKLGERTNLTKENVRKLTKISISGLFALFISLFTVGVSDSNAVEEKPQVENDNVKPISDSCWLKPEGGPCKAFFEKYYFDAKTNECKKFIYGGCDGVVPFETQDECNKACIGQGSERPGNPDFPVSKYGAVGPRDF